jgi:two-component system, NtrC family, response regulator AtoC
MRPLRDKGLGEFRQVLPTTDELNACAVHRNIEIYEKRDFRSIGYRDGGVAVAFRIRVHHPTLHAAQRGACFLINLTSNSCRNFYLRLSGVPFAKEPCGSQSAAHLRKRTKEGRCKVNHALIVGDDRSSAEVAAAMAEPENFSVARMQDELEANGHFGHLWGRSATMQTIYQQISRVAATGVTVLITGESGTGKELVARTVHDLSRRCTGPYLAINCGAIAPHLIESEIFGHEKGSFTGADRQRLGFFERARGGTLFLDEITEMPLELQVKLLRVLETGTFTRVGSCQLHETDVRLIAATNRAPAEAVAQGKLRDDLYYRLNVFQIELPSLRERKEDVPLLAEHFLLEMNAAEKASKKFSGEALEQLAAYPWPGNVRELRNAIQRAFVMAPSELIDPAHLPVNHAAETAATTASNASELGDAQPDSQASITIPLGTSMAETEKLLIRATLKHYDDHKERTAAVLGLSLKTLYNRLRNYSQERGEESVQLHGPISYQGR